MTNDKLQDVFSDMALNEPITIELEGREIQLDVRATDLHPLMEMGEGGADMDAVHDALQKILQRTYLTHYDHAADEIPDNLSDEEVEENRDDREWIEGLLVRYYPTIFEQLSVELGWQDEEEIERRKQQARRQQGNQSPQL